MILNQNSSKIFIIHSSAFHPQIVEIRKKAEEDAKNNEALEEYRKKVAREMEVYQVQLDDARAQADRAEKSRRKLQEEVGDYFS